MSKNNLSVFYVSKPLQYFNAVNIIDDNPKICLFVDHFYGAEEVYKQLQSQSTHWEEIILFRNPKEAYEWMHNNKEFIADIFIDSDYGFIKNLWLYKLRKKNIFVYEEGLGSYTKNRRQNGFTQSIINFFLKLIGTDDYIGGSRFTKGIIIYDHNKHRLLYPNYKKQRISFRRQYFTHLYNFEEINLFVNNEVQAIISNLQGRKVFLYITPWIYNKSADDFLKEFDNYVKILKPHPHMREDHSELLNKYDYIINNGVMIEFILIRLVKVVKELVIIHENSTALMCLEESDVLKIIEIK